ncbi:hypothetical protein [Alloalcanivorax gelatiniphagus]|uniref:Uncharacterized protein n=1 Tax=Alloalcanivorax gelatiniphagus TaxID=1194167 RepID=A0ABY2XRR0_9GAMM|nr:hypothetical protein [Alloalcanivorax gelatiniphagus]TMW14611.1 hypothetical protein FGS76_02150 [Alloalcanivorax gelatiniphagus]
MGSSTPTRTSERVRRGLIAALPVLVALHSHPASGDEPDYDAIMDAMFDTRDARLDRIENIADAEVGSTLQDLSQDALYNDLNNVDWAMPPAQTRHGRSALARLDDYADIQAMTEVFLDNLLATTWADYLCVEARRPFAYPLPHRIDWHGLRMDNGDTLPFAGQPGAADHEQALMRHRFDERYCFEKRPAADDAKPMALLGEFIGRVPEKRETFTFPSPEAGQQRTQGGYTVTLTATTDHGYAMEVRAEDGGPMPLDKRDVIAEGLDQDGRPLARTLVQTGAPALFELAGEEVDGLIDRALKEDLTAAALEQHLAQAEARIRERTGDTHYTRVAFKGPVATARITLLDRDPEQPLMKRKLALPLKQVDGLNPTAQFDPEAIQAVPLPGPVYRSAVDGPMELTAEEVPSRLRIVQNDGRTPLYTHSVDFRYPKVESRRFLERDSERIVLKDGPNPITFLDADGQPIPLPDGDHSDYYRFTVNRIDYNPQRFSSKPVRVSADLRVRVFRDVHKSRHARGELPEGLQLQENRLVVDTEVIDTPLFAVDDQGRFLKQALTRTYQRKGQAPVEVIHFYGTPAALEIWTSDGPTEDAYRAEVELEERTDI